MSRIKVLGFLWHLIQPFSFFSSANGHHVTNGKPAIFRPGVASGATSSSTSAPTTTSGGGGGGAGTTTPELSMVMEKAQVLLTSGEFSALNLLLDDYISETIGVEEFSDELLQMFAGGEKVRREKKKKCG